MRHLALSLLIACGGHGAPAREPSDDPTPWCLRLEREGRTWKACAETIGLCEWGRSRVRSMGGVAGVTAVGECWGDE